MLLPLYEVGAACTVGSQDRMEAKMRECPLPPKRRMANDRYFYRVGPPRKYDGQVQTLTY